MKKIESDSHELLEGNEDKVDFKWYMTFAKYFFEYEESNSEAGY